MSLKNISVKVARTNASIAIKFVPAIIAKLTESFLVSSIMPQEISKKSFIINSMQVTSHPKLFFSKSLTFIESKRQVTYKKKLQKQF